MLRVGWGVRVVGVARVDRVVRIDRFVRGVRVSTVAPSLISLYLRQEEVGFDHSSRVIYSRHVLCVLLLQCSRCSYFVLW